MLGNMKAKAAHIYSPNIKAFLLLLALLSAFSSFSQKKGKNLVPNPSFETRKTNKGGDVKNAIPWVGVGTVDYYVKPEKRDTSRYKGARTGTGYAGLRFQSDYKEYMWVKLNEPLERNEVYHFKMYVRLLETNSVTVTVKQLGAYFSEEPFRVGMMFIEDGLVDSTYSKGIAGTLNWILIQGDYTARGGEKYIIIGNFRTKMKDDFVKKKKWDFFEFKEAYYYIDDISVRKILTPKDSSKTGTKEVAQQYPDNFSAGQHIVIENLYWEPGSDKLMNKSYKALEILVNALNQHPFMEVEIQGFSDNIGNESQARKLSRDRAKAVYDYLKSQEIINPMTYKGMGQVNFVAPNDTEENKAKNRRLELVIIKE
jgi:outer membrane protein OmpA-like peptidoglycan-associated protein